MFDPKGCHLEPEGNWYTKMVMGGLKKEGRENFGSGTMKGIGTLGGPEKSPRPDGEESAHLVTLKRALELIERSQHTW